MPTTVHDVPVYLLYKRSVVLPSCDEVSISNSPIAVADYA